MKYLSTFEVAEKWGISLRRVRIFSAMKTASRVHSGQEAGGSSRKMHQNRQMPVSKAENISNTKIMERRAANVRSRIVDLMKERKVSQKKAVPCYWFKREFTQPFSQR